MFILIPGIALGLVSGLGISGARNIRRYGSKEYDHYLPYHILNGVASQDTSINKLKIKSAKEIMDNRLLIEENPLVKKRYSAAWSMLDKLTKFVRQAKVARNIYVSLEAIYKAQNTKEGWKSVGEKITKTTINSACIAIGAYLGGQLGLITGGILGIETGPGAVVTATVLAIIGSTAGSYLGDVVGDYISDKVMHFGGKATEFLYDIFNSKSN